MNQHPNHESHLDQYHVMHCCGIGIKKTIKSFKGLGYANSLYVSVALPSSLFVQYAWRDNPTAIG